jgi:hypothetical protein
MDLILGNYVTTSRLHIWEYPAKEITLQFDQIIERNCVPLCAHLMCTTLPILDYSLLNLPVFPIGLVVSAVTAVAFGCFLG